METTEEISEIKTRMKKEQRQLFIKRLFSNKLMVFCGLLIIFLIIVATFGPMITKHGVYEMVVQDRLQAPSKEHLLGTDEFGRDLLARIVEGSRVTMGVGFAVAAITSFFGMVIGLYASYYRTLDHILMRISDGLMSIPAILLAIALMAALGPNTRNVIIALSIVFIPHIARDRKSTRLNSS